jgi:hypothetical protein
MNGAVSDGGQSFIVGHDYKSLPELVAQIEEELMQFFLILRVE